MEWKFEQIDQPYRFIAYQWSKIEGTACSPAVMGSLKEMGEIELHFCRITLKDDGGVK